MYKEKEKDLYQKMSQLEKLNALLEQKLEMTEKYMNDYKKRVD